MLLNVLMRINLNILGLNWPEPESFAISGEMSARRWPLITFPSVSFNFFELKMIKDKWEKATRLTIGKIVMSSAGFSGLSGSKFSGWYQKTFPSCEIWSIQVRTDSLMFSEVQPDSSLQYGYLSWFRRNKYFNSNWIFVALFTRL